eukprot:12026318-Prorocentrum_lima.AAC.1
MAAPIVLSWAVIHMPAILLRSKAAMGGAMLLPRAASPNLWGSVAQGRSRGNPIMAAISAHVGRVKAASPSLAGSRRQRTEKAPCFMSRAQVIGPLHWQGHCRVSLPSRCRTCGTLRPALISLVSIDLGQKSGWR